MNVDLSKVPNLEKRKEAERIGVELQARIAELKEQQRAIGRLDRDFDGNVRRCALSGLPTFSDDELLWDNEADECVLRCLVLPPRPVVEEEAEAAE